MKKKFQEKNLENIQEEEFTKCKQLLRKQMVLNKLLKKFFKMQQGHFEEQLRIYENKLREQNLNLNEIRKYVCNCYFSCQSGRETEDIMRLINESKYPVGNLSENDLESVHDHLNFIFKHKPLIYKEDEFEKCDLVYIWGLWGVGNTSNLIIKAQMNNIPILIFEDGFFWGIKPPYPEKKQVLGKYFYGFSMVIDDIGLYINARKDSRLEEILNSNYQLRSDQYQRAKNLINLIVKEKLSKYNHQPIIKLKLGSQKRKKVLIIDQVAKDKSIVYGMANENVFQKMLEKAINDNPDADIIVKTHPVVNQKRASRKGHYNNLEEYGHVYKLTEEINPICLLEDMDKVYVCTSQMGFEALMCGKEVHVFGMPFYAGWGLTKDYQVCKRRTKTRSLEEVFYISYIMYSKYVSYKTKSICEIEQALEEILELREEYFYELK